MKFTGERIVTEFTNHIGVIEHLHRYAIAIQLCKNKKVLDIACGEGYGSFLMSKSAESVIGVDISDEAVEHAQNKYVSPNLQFLQGSADKMPVKDSSVDVVVSFETLEHHDKHEEMFMEIKRVLVPGGILIMSSPERSIYYERDPNNPYHIKEITLEDFVSLTSRHFVERKVYRQRFVYGSLISEYESKDEKLGLQFYSGDYQQINKGLDENIEFYNKPYFNLVFASDNKIDFDTNSLFDAAYLLSKLNEQVSLQKDYNQLITNYKNSYSFKLANFILSILKVFRFKK